MFLGPEGASATNIFSHAAVIPENTILSPKLKVSKSVDFIFSPKHHCILVKTGRPLKIENQKAAPGDGPEGESVVCARKKESFWGEDGGWIFEMLENYGVF